MNIAFPKAQYTIVAFDKVGIASSISLNVQFLNLVQRSVLGGVGVPKIPIPLDYHPLIRQQNVNDEFAADDLLLQIGDAQTVQNGTPGHFQRINPFAGGNMQKSLFRVSRCISAIVAAIMRAIAHGYIAVCTPPRNIKRFLAGFTPLDIATPTPVNGSCSSLLFRFGLALPDISTIQRAKAHSAFSTRNKRVTAPFTGKCTTRVTPASGVGTRRKWLLASDAYLLTCYIIHRLIIPWSVEKSK